MAVLRLDAILLEDLKVSRRETEGSGAASRKRNAQLKSGWTSSAELTSLASDLPESVEQVKKYGLVGTQNWTAIVCDDRHAQRKMIDHLIPMGVSVERQPWVSVSHRIALVGNSFCSHVFAHSPHHPTCRRDL